MLPFDWSATASGPDAARVLVGSIARQVRAAVRKLDGRRFLGALGGTEAQLDEILDWLQQTGRQQRRALFFDAGISGLDQAVFFTWLASEWAYFAWVADDRNFWPRLGLDILGAEPNPSDYHALYSWLRSGFEQLGLQHHLADSETGWRYVESLRRQSGLPRAWWECVYRIVQDAKHHRDIRGNWASRLQQEQECWPRSFGHAARTFPVEVNAFFDAVHETFDSRSAEPLRRLNHAFAREPDTLAEYLIGDKQFRSYVEMLRGRRAQRRDARVRRSGFRFWIDSVDVGIGALERNGRWSISFAAFLPDTIPREKLPAEIASATALTLSAWAAGSEPVSEEVRYERGTDGLRALKPDPFVLLGSADSQSRLVARAALPDGTRRALEVAGLFASDESPAMFYQASVRRPDFYVPVPLLPDERSIEVPERRSVLLVLPREKKDVACEPEAVAVMDLGSSWTVRVLRPPAPSCDILVGEDIWKLTAKPPLPGELVLDGPRLGVTAGERIFTSWPRLAWEGAAAVRLHDLRVVPAPLASNAGRVRRLVGGEVVLEPGRPVALDELTFAIADGPPGRLPREFIGRALLRVQIGRGSERWHLAHSFKLVPQTELCPGLIKTEDTWRLPLQVVVKGVETLRLTPRWELTAGGLAQEVSWEGKAQGDELNLEASIPIEGSRLTCRLHYGFRRQLPPDLEPGFAIDLECPLSGPVGYLLDASVEPKVVRPLGPATVLRSDELVAYFLVLSHDGSTEGTQVSRSLVLGERRLPVSGGQMALAHVRQELGALLRQCTEVPVYLETPGRTRLGLFTVRSDEAPEKTAPPSIQLRRTPLQELVRHELRYADRDTYRQTLAQAVLEGLICPPAEHCSWETCWRAVAQVRLRDFAGWEPSREIVAAYDDELGRSGTHIALPWLWTSWGRSLERAEKDLVKYPGLSRLVERLETLGRGEGFGFLPALLAGAQDLGPDTVLPRARDRMRYLILMLCTGCQSSTAYRALSMKSIPKGPRAAPQATAPWWISKPQDLKYPLAWELTRVKLEEQQLRTLKACYQVTIDDPRLTFGDDADEDALDLTCGVIDLELQLERRHSARPVVRAALACSQEWARYVVDGGDSDALTPLLDAFHVVCKQAPVLTRALCIDAVLHEMDRHEVGAATWDASHNDGQADLDAFPELWKHLKVSQVN